MGIGGRTFLVAATLPGLAACASFRADDAQSVLRRGIC